VAVVFHEPYRQEGSSAAQRVRGAFQDWIIRRLYGLSTKAIFADPLETIAWLPEKRAKATFIPIGGNIPEPDSQKELSSFKNSAAKTAAVFCVDGPPHRERQLGDIAHAARCAVAEGSKLKLVFIGRGTPEAQQEIDRTFLDIPVQVSNLGLLSADEVSRTLAGADVMLCVRGQLFPRRGSALAGIACGLPIIAYAGSSERTPLAEAGIELVPWGDRNALGAALVRVLSDEHFREELRRKSLRAQEAYFSWHKIAAAFVSALCEKQARP
jgi:glycosyltransferase involved in cell wall biosynthesis